MKKKAVIIEASLGIGRECALYLGKKGWIVVVCGRRENLLDELASTNEDAITICIPAWRIIGTLLRIAALWR
jgi:NADP-dependent 3-hydroxy acid dehydrogenase YdfG